MKINSISDLRQFIEKLFDVNFEQYHFNINENLPVALKEIHKIDMHFASDNCAYETIRFFRNMDRLTFYNDLKTSEEQFVFANENQGNWYAKTSLHSEKVYIYGHEELEDGTILNENLEEFLITFALLEISNNFKFFCGLYEKSEDKVKSKFRKIEELWPDKMYIIRPTSFYLIDDEVLFDQANMTIATNNEEKFNYYRTIFETYLYH
jgi:hypothetical protein